MTTSGRLAWSIVALSGVTFAANITGCGGGSPPPAQSASSGSSADTQSLASDSPAPRGEPQSSADLDAGTKAFNAGNFADARASFEAAVKKAPRNYDAQFYLGLACEKLGDAGAAETAYKGALAAKPDYAEAASQLGAMYVDAGRTDEAIAVMRAGVAKTPRSASLHENLGVALATKGDQDGATKEFDFALQITPGDAMMQVTIAHWFNVWHVRGAAPHLDVAVGLVKDDVPMLVEIGFEYRMAGEFASCVKTFDHAIAVKDGGEVRTDRALCKLGLKDEKGMLEDLQAAVSKEPTYATAHYYLAGRLAKNKKFKEAAAEYGKYLELAPTGSLAKEAAQEAAKKK
jgi:Tfp pilus assembly protein PilF